MKARGTGDTGGFAKLPNELVTRGILAHLRPCAVKVYLAILLAARSGTLTCFPGVKTLARWSGVPRGKVPEETDYLERHKLIEKGWLQLGGKPRRKYRVIQVGDPMFPDYRESCRACKSTEHRKSCEVRDPITGRLFGKRSQPKSPDHRDAHSPDHRDSHMITDHRETNQTEADEKVRSRRGGGVGEPDGALRSASPRDAASLRAPDLEAQPDGERKAASKGPESKDTRHAALVLWLKTGMGDMPFRIRYAKKAGHSGAEIEAAKTEVERCGPSESTNPADGYPGSHPSEIVAASAWGGPPSDTSGSIPGKAAIDPNRRCEGTTRDRSECFPGPSQS
jgi:hypothetical protein